MIQCPESGTIASCTCSAAKRITVVIKLPTTKLSHALAHADAGLPVFPITPNAKEPPLVAFVKGGPDERPSTNPDRIRRWWKESPNAMEKG